jgi:tetratricopeptide (TPR) repeat protein
LRLCELAEVELQSGESRHAVQNVQEALELARKIGTKDIEAQALLTLAEVNDAAGHYEAASKDADRALAIAQQLGISYLENAARVQLQRASTMLANQSGEILTSNTINSSQPGLTPSQTEAPSDEQRNVSERRNSEQKGEEQSESLSDALCRLSEEFGDTDAL